MHMYYKQTQYTQQKNFFSGSVEHLFKLSSFVFQALKQKKIPANLSNQLS